MPLPDQALWFYRQMTARNRRRLLDRLREDRCLPIAILFYHRVAQRDMNPWSISFDDFRHHLDWLQSNFELVTLSEAQGRIRRGDNDRHCVAITFDDGYADNTQFAIPELVSRRIPMTYFVATHFVESGTPFPHDLALGRPLDPNTVDELRHYVDQGIEIGAHTRSHCDIGTVTNPSQLWEEVAGSIQTLRQWLGIPCSYFAFPYGHPKNMSQEAVDLLTKLDINGFCSGYGALNWPGNDAYHLRRIHADPGIQRLKNWLTLDSRKLSEQVQLPFLEPPHRLPELVNVRS